VKGDMTGRSLTRRIIILGGEAFWRGDCSSGLDFLVLLLGSAVLGNHCRGHRVAGGFGHGGQDSFRFPGARESYRILLAGWEVSWFGQVWSVHRAGQGSRERTTRSTGELASGRGNLFYSVK
jgi:hypothetical protein